jgi:Family of unknown function (DUF6350)
VVIRCDHRQVTSTIDRPPAKGEPSQAERKPRQNEPIMAAIPVAAVSAAAWAAICGLAGIGIFVTIGWVLSPRAGDGLSVPIESAGLLWCASHHAGISVDGATITLLPIALLLIPLSLLRIAGRWAARITAVQGWVDQTLLVVAGTTAYVLIAFGVSQLCDLNGAAQVSTAMTVFWSALIGSAGLALGILAAKGGWRQVWTYIPDDVRPVLIAAAAMAWTLTAICAAMGAVALIMNWSGVIGLSRALGTSVTDVLGIFVLSCVYLPNLLLWVLGYISGVGVVIGGGATANVFSVSGGLLPSIPVLAAIPADPGRFAPLLVVLPVLAGAVGAIVLHKRFTFELRDEILSLLSASAVVAFGVLGVAWLSAGSLGADRLSYLGPKPLLTALAVFALTACGATAYTLITFIVPTLRARDTADAVTP